MSSRDANKIISNLTRAVCPLQCERADNQCPLQFGYKNVRAERGKLHPIIFMSWLWLSDIPITPKLTSPTLIVSSVLSSLLSAYRGDKVVNIAQY